MPPSVVSFILPIFIQLIMYGLYFVTFLHSIQWIVFTEDGWSLRSRRSINWPMLAMATTVFFFMTVVTLTSVSFPLLALNPHVNPRLFHGINLMTMSVECLIIVHSQELLMHYCILI
ncbi:hypothetical protein AMATHDRAFT_184300 [Amanita thiersii Skay4041]|uniref:Uncharacterized protein n=1 Tax=Amanita thiersii Skay4041 TaxID=703135 RepID=A0A2A9NDL7_9AGAR|nr:hypothetical protein AMATHDRAFT_184300 [Amanita thiersii Skay4041]